MHAVKPLLGIGISVGVLAGIWTYASAELALITWVAFVAWACFFAAGGGTTGLLPVATTMLSAVNVSPPTCSVRAPVNRAWPV